MADIETPSTGSAWGGIGGTLADQTDLAGALAGKASLVSGKVPAGELPSYVDDVIEAANFAALPASGETGKIYVTQDDGKVFRWSGSAYVGISDVPAFASQAEAEAGVDNTKLMTPLRTAEAIAAAPGGAGLVNFTEAMNTASPNDTVNAASLTPTGGGTHIGLILKPKGANGYIAAAIPDGTTAGGNARGAGAVDLQIGSRGLSDQVASGDGAFAAGVHNKASGAYSSVLGLNNIASGAFSISSGYLATASGSHAVALGESVTASGSHSAVLGGYLNAAGGTYAVAFGVGSSASGEVSFAGIRGLASGNYSVAIGHYATASGHKSVCLGGYLSVASGESSVAIGEAASATGAYSISIGYQASVSGVTGVALGYKATVSGQGGVSIQGGTTGGAGGVASGYGSLIMQAEGGTAAGQYGVAIGVGGKADANYAVGLHGKVTSAHPDNAFATGDNPFATHGDSQAMRFTARRRTTDATPTELKGNADGTAYLRVPTDRCFSGSIKVQAVTQGMASYASWQGHLIVNNDGGTVTAVVSGSLDAIGSNAGAPPSGWAVAITADDTNNGLKIEVTGAAATNIQWTALFDGVDQTYP